MRIQQIPLEKGGCLTAYLHEPEKQFANASPRQAVLICPGGAYQRLSKREGEPVALAYLAEGFSAFVLQYSVGKGVQWPLPLEQAREALCLIRQNAREVSRIAEQMDKALDEEVGIPHVIGIGSVVGQLKDIARSFKEAQIAVDVGHVFNEDKTVMNFENLGIGRLIYQLPTTLCEMFLSEVFKKGSIDSLDEETLFTIQKFFENNLNVSETSRKLFVHRNTLVYRLEKIKKLTGLDLREFDNAIVLKVALMVKQYLRSRETMA